MTDYDLIRRCDVLEILDYEGFLGRTRKLVEQLVAVTPEAQAAEIEMLRGDVEKLIGGAETVLEAWDRHMRDVVVSASLNDAIEELRADVAEAKGGKDAKGNM